MTDLKNYLQDGANYQARSVLMFLQRDANIEESWNKDRNYYEASIKVSRWENCREQGYICSLYVPTNNKQLNICFFEHRNGDSIHAVMWEQFSINSITIYNAEFGDVYKTKYDTSFSVKYGQIVEMSDWIINQFRHFWIENIT